MNISLRICKNVQFEKLPRQWQDLYLYFWECLCHRCFSFITGAYLPPPMPFVPMPVPAHASHPEWQYDFFYIVPLLACTKLVLVLFMCWIQKYIYILNIEDDTFFLLCKSTVNVLSNNPQNIIFCVQKKTSHFRPEIWGWINEHLHFGLNNKVTFIYLHKPNICNKLSCI